MNKQDLDFVTKKVSVNTSEQSKNCRNYGVCYDAYDGVYYTVTEINSSAQLLRLNTNQKKKCCLRAVDLQ